ncbi:MAG: glutamate--tRNA ligase family protein, partial [Planctomycetota bacterium]|nr:glutamate--tRNA ligase family protein [Planctomycetota bacterium]
QLLDAELAYHAFETPEEIEAARKEAQNRKEQYRYDRAALNIPKQERFDRASREDHVVRFRMPDESITVHDEVLGDVTVQASELDDFIIRKRDGFPTYHFAVVVDDATMGVTNVIRAQEHLINTPRHVALQRALGFNVPAYAHLPLIFNPDGAKMSKRDKDKAAREACRAAGMKSSPIPAIPEAEFTTWLGDKKRQLQTNQLIALAEKINIQLPEINVDEFREAGYLPEVICNYIALLGWSPGDDIEKFDMTFLAERFDLKRIGKTNARFDRRKLLAFNNDAITEMSESKFRERLRTYCARFRPALVDGLDERRFNILADAQRVRCKTLLEAAEGAQFALLDGATMEYDAKAVDKVIAKGDGVTTLASLRDILAGVSPFEPAPIQTALESFAQERSLSMGKVAQPLRVALTGTTVSPSIDATIAVVGKDETLRRIDRVIERFAHASSGE